MLSEPEHYTVNKEDHCRKSIIGHLQQPDKKLGDYGANLALTVEIDWIIDPFVVKNLHQLPFRVAKNFT